MRIPLLILLAFGALLTSTFLGCAGGSGGSGGNRPDLRGAVVTTTGASVQGATLTLSSADTPERTLTLEDGGQFSFPDLTPQQTYTLDVAGDDLIRTVSTVTVPSSGLLGLLVHAMTPDELPLGVAPPLDGTATILGFLHNRSDVLVPALVSAGGRTSQAGAPALLTGVMPGLTTTSLTEASTGLTMAARYIVVRPNEILAVRLRLSSSATAATTVSGQVFYTVTNQPLLGAEVLLQDPSDGRIIHQSTTDGQGQFHLAGVIAGNYLVRVTSGNLAARTNVFTVGAQAVTLATLNPHSSVTLSGRLGTAPTPLATKTLYLLQGDLVVQGTQSDAQGLFTFPNVLPGTYRLRRLDTGGTTPVVPVTNSDLALGDLAL
jgi:hypothetical protein